MVENRSPMGDPVWPAFNSRLRLGAGRFQVEEGALLWSPLRPAMCLRDGVAAHGTPEIVSDRVPISGKGFSVGPVLHR